MYGLKATASCSNQIYGEIPELLTAILINMQDSPLLTSIQLSSSPITHNLGKFIILSF